MLLPLGCYVIAVRLPCCRWDVMLPLGYLSVLLSFGYDVVAVNIMCYCCLDSVLLPLGYHDFPVRTDCCSR